MSKQEQANLKGGPVPPGYMAAAAKRKAEADKQVPQSYKDWLARRNTAQGKPDATPPATP